MGLFGQIMGAMECGELEYKQFLTEDQKALDLDDLYATLTAEQTGRLVEEFLRVEWKVSPALLDRLRRYLRRRDVNFQRLLTHQQRALLASKQIDHLIASMDSSQLQFFFEKVEKKRKQDLGLILDNVGMIFKYLGDTQKELYRAGSIEALYESILPDQLDLILADWCVGEYLYEERIEALREGTFCPAQEKEMFDYIERIVAKELNLELYFTPDQQVYPLKHRIRSCSVEQILAIYRDYVELEKHKRGGLVRAWEQRLLERLERSEERIPWWRFMLRVRAQ